MLLQLAMHRYTAKLLLLLLAVNAGEPVLQAFSVEPPHACCLRRLHASKDKDNVPQISDRAPHSNNCCSPLTLRQSANVIKRDIAVIPLDASRIHRKPGNLFRTVASSANLSVRAPPAFSLS